MKIAVYAICKNESKNIQEFVTHLEDKVDEIVIVDTGSTDDSKQIILALPNIKSAFINLSPFRFDDARNFALSLVSPDVDICVSLDLDERMLSGWREIIETHFLDGNIDQLFYKYQLQDGSLFTTNRIHKRFGFKWEHACHEFLSAKTSRSTFTPAILISHHPDPSKSRSIYLELLQLDYEENPHDRRSQFYLAREYYYQKQYAPAIDLFLKFIDNNKCVNYEYEYALRLLSLMYYHIGDEEKALKYAGVNCAYFPKRRETFHTIAYLNYKLGIYDDAEFYAKKASQNTRRLNEFTDNPKSWDGDLEYLISLIASKKNNVHEMLTYLNKTLEKNMNHSAALASLVNILKEPQT